MYLRYSLVSFLLALLLATTSRGSAEAFSLLTYNIKGLPPLVLEDAGPARIIDISQHLKGYDLVMLQEVFAYRDLVQSTARPMNWFDGPAAQFSWKLLPALIPLYLPCKLSQFCEMPSSAGLAVMTFHPALHSSLLVSHRFADCHGILKSSNDCMAAKGLVGIAVSVGKHQIHVYTTHLDAGRGSDDQLAREQQLIELAQAIKKYSQGHALLVGGDLNLQRADRRDMTMLATFLEATNLTNSGAFENPDCNFGCKGLDYILYRSGGHTRVSIGSTSKSQADQFIDSKGDALSDHPPLVVTFTLASE